MAVKSKFLEFAPISRARRERLGEALAQAGVKQQQLFELLAPMLDDRNPSVSRMAKSDYLVPHTDLARIAGCSVGVVRAARSRKWSRQTEASFAAWAGLILACHVLAQNSKTGWGKRFGYKLRFIENFLKGLLAVPTGLGTEFLSRPSYGSRYFYLRFSLSFWSEDDFRETWDAKRDAFLRKSNLLCHLREIDTRFTDTLRTRGQKLVVTLPRRDLLPSLIAPIILICASDKKSAQTTAREQVEALMADDVGFLLASWSDCLYLDDSRDQMFAVCVEHRGVWGLGFRQDQVLGQKAQDMPWLTARLEANQWDGAPFTSIR